MAQYIEYKLDDGSTVLIEAGDEFLPPAEGGEAVDEDAADGFLGKVPGVMRGMEEKKRDRPSPPPGAPAPPTSTPSDKRFSDALKSVKASAKTLMDSMKELQADEVEVQFSLKTIGEAGNFAIGKVGVEANYNVTLKWTNRVDGKPVRH